MDKEQYRTLVEKCPEAIIVHSGGGFLYANMAAARLYGADSPEQIIGRDVFSHVHPDDREAAKARIPLVLEQDQTTSFKHFRILRLDEQPVDVESASSRIIFQGQPALQVVLHDITARMRAEEALRESEDRFRSLFKFSPDAIFISEPDGTVLSANPAACEMLGWSEQELCRLGRAGIIDTDDPRLAEALERRRQNGTLLQQELTAIRKGGERFPIEVDSFILPGLPVRSFVIMHDITERKRAEVALRDSNEVLERSVAQRTAELRRTIDLLQEEVEFRIQVEQALRERSEQLRALAAELTMAEHRERRRLAHILHDDLQQLLVGAKLRLSMLGRTPEENTSCVIEQVQDLLDASLERSRCLTAELSPPILHQGGLIPALKWLAAWMREKHCLGVELALDDKAAPGSEDTSVLLFQSARELLFNAVKHAGVQTARVGLRKVDGQIELTVADDGLGFDTREAGPKPGKSGGFGLFSIRERLDLMGGKMDIESSPGKGSRFTLLAPTGDSPADVLQSIYLPVPKPTIAPR